MITEPAPAKINLALHVCGRRADGYHDIETVFAFCADGDTVTVERAEEDQFAIIGPFADALLPVPASPRSTTFSPEGERASGENLVLRAALAFTARFSPGAAHAVTLDKHLPVASGVGGGSADAAATLRALARLHGVEDQAGLAEIAASLGADVPACLYGRAAFGVGRGDDLRAIAPLGNIPVLLVNPGVALSTAAVFARWDGEDRGPLDPADWRAARNDLQTPARGLAPAIDDVLAYLDEQSGATLVRMSGSGATCFALFEGEDARDRAAAATPDAWWRLATRLP